MGRTKNSSTPVTKRFTTSWAYSTPLAAAPCVFFFQAEDGIRDLTVTGVQTCALPIFRSRLPPLAGLRSRPSAAGEGLPRVHRVRKPGRRRRDDPDHALRCGGGFLEDRKSVV